MLLSTFSIQHIKLTTEKCRFVSPFAYIPITPHLPSRVNDSTYGRICVWWLYTPFSVCVCLRISSISGLKKMESSRVNLALLSFPQHFFMCNYIPPLIENRTLPKFSHNKELLFPRCAYVRVWVCVWVCVCGNNCLLSVSISTHLVIKVDIIWEVDYRLIVLMFL